MKALDRDAYHRAIVQPMFNYAFTELNMNGITIGKEVARVKEECPEEIERFAGGTLGEVEPGLWRDFLYELTAIRYVIHLREVELAKGLPANAKAKPGSLVAPVTYGTGQPTPGGRCIHDVDRGCWICKKRAS